MLFILFSQVSFMLVRGSHCARKSGNVPLARVEVSGILAADSVENSARYLVCFCYFTFHEQH